MSNLLNPPKPKYRSLRLSCQAGYNEAPVLRSHMIFNLLQRPVVTSRIVQSEGRYYELWSPNSRQLPFFPGERPLSGQSPSIPPPDQRHYDSHVGRHDCIYFPHYFDTQTAHWPFMCRPSLVPRDDPAYMAYRPLTQVWRRNATESYLGSFSIDFVSELNALRQTLDLRYNNLHRTFKSTSRTWSRRPTFPTLQDVTNLYGVTTWDDAVDMGVAVQRGLRERLAWLDMVRVQREGGAPDTVERLRSMTMPLVDDSLIGVWVNRLEERTVLTFLALRIPCFIIHEYEDVNYPLRTSAPTYSDFLDGTDAVNILTSNVYEAVARANPYQLDHLCLPHFPSS
ncbi:hypothetical protein C8R45DRAFT_935590 [Mycena sanguinolenta]|nr:hypothetical protein C8R45DRAFT_935590 [Mycena sanguinolenta]